MTLLANVCFDFAATASKTLLVLSGLKVLLEMRVADSALLKERCVAEKRRCRLHTPERFLRFGLLSCRGWEHFWEGERANSLWAARENYCRFYELFLVRKLAAPARSCELIC